jgi:hypothetical protein
MRCVRPARSPVSSWFLGFADFARPAEVLVVVGVTGFCFYLAYSLTYLLVLKCGVTPIPIFLEQCPIPR